MERYADSDDECRSHQLLRYFGEKRGTDCNQCDVCLEQKTDQLSKSRLQTPVSQIMDLLEDGKEHLITDLLRLQLPDRQLEGALEYLIAEEKIAINGSLISRTNKKR